MERLPPPLFNVSLLVVEDDSSTRELVREAIKRQLPDVTLYTAENGEAGLELFKRHHPDIVLTDISMPIMNGIEMAEQIRRLDSAAKIIAVTAVSDTRHLLDAIRIGIARYVIKPVKLELLFDAIDDCLSRIRLERQVEAQNQSIRQLSRAVQQSPSAVVIANARGAIEYVNPRFTKITGYGPEEVIGQNLRLLVGNITPPDSLEMLWSSITRGSEWRGEMINRHKNGTPYYAEVVVSALSNEDGRNTNLVAVIEDVSRRKYSEEKIRRLNDELEQRVKERTVKMEAANRELEAFCYSVAHDLSAPLRGISGYSSMLLEDHADCLDDTGKLYLDRIGAASVKMGELIRDLLNLSRVTRGIFRRSRINLTALANETIASLREQDPAREVETYISEGIEADGDPALMRLVVDNLLGNAWKYTSRERCARIEFGTGRAGKETHYYVRDNGIGFHMDHAPKLFVPFQRLQEVEAFEGSGIGLATVERIVSRHGGRVWAEGSEGKGASFYFTLGSPGTASSMG